MDAKDEVKDRLSVEEVVGDYLELKKSGSNYKALSPWTSEKTPSFMVSPAKQIWHDFSSGKGGDIFSFVMEMEGVDFRQALEMLARKAGVELKDFRTGSIGKKKEQLFKAHELAAKYYLASLTKNKKALKYVVENRGFKKAIVESFKIGYSPSSGTALVNFLSKKGFSSKEIKDAGLAVTRRDQLIDMFRNRMMIPLSDSQGRIVGFTARIIDETDTGPKYLNTPQTIIYDKGRQVFGLHQAKSAIREKGFVVVVEGNLDVVASHKAKVANVVASAGTALTKQHLLQLSRLTDDVRLAFDADDAGIRATERVIPIAQEIDIKVSIIELPKDQDPDDLIKKDVKDWQKVIDNPVYVIDWVIDQYKDRLDISSSQGKKTLSDKALSVISRLSDPVEQEHYLRVLAEAIGVRLSTVQAKLDKQEKSTPPKTRRIKTKKIPKEEINKLKGAEFIDQLLGLNLMYPEVRQSLSSVKVDTFSDPRRRAILELIKSDSVKTHQEVPKELLEYADYVKIILFKTEELYGSWSSSDRMIEAIGLANRLATARINRQKEILSDQIKAAEEAGDDAQVQELLEQFQKLLKE